MRKSVASLMLGLVGLVHARFAHADATPPVVVTSTGAAAVAPAPARSTEIFLSIRGTRSAFLEHRTLDGAWERICRAPCDRAIAREGTFRIDGPGQKPSAPFELEGKESVVILVDPAGLGGRVLGITGISVGGLMIMGGLLHMLSSGSGFCDPSLEGGHPSECERRDATTSGSVRDGGLAALAGAVLTTAGTLGLVSNARAETRVAQFSDGAPVRPFPREEKERERPTAPTPESEEARSRAPSTVARASGRSFTMPLVRFSF